MSDSPTKSASLLATVAVVIGLADLPYGYYMLLRLFLCGVSLFLLFDTRLMLKDWHRWLMGGLAVLYNPVLPIQIGDQGVWQVLNVATVVWFWFMSFQHTPDSLPKLGLTIEERSVGDITILDLKGAIALGAGDEFLTDKTNSLLLQGRKKFVLNLADLLYIDSAGLAAIVRTSETVSRQGGNLKLLGLTKRIVDLLGITKLLTVFETYDSEADAVRSFSSPDQRRPGAIA